MSTVPWVAGDRDMPEWWTERDEEILRGELEKLADLRPVVDPRAVAAAAGAEPRLCFCRPGPGHLPGHRNEDRRPGIPWRKVLRVLGVLLLAAAALTLVVLLGSAAAQPNPCAGDAAGCADVITPATYGPPGPHGGPVRAAAR